MTVLMSTKSRPLRMLVLVSATGGNLRTACDFAEANPDLLKVALVASDRSSSPALEVARSRRIPTWPGDFERRCGRYSSCHTEAQKLEYRKRSVEFHDALTDRVAEFEASDGPIDVVLLAYHRWIHGSFLRRFHRRIINQHPGDLASLTSDNDRALVGLDPVGVALRRGDRATRTSTFLVDDSHDGGAVLARGPWVPYNGPRPPSDEDVVAHENQQKIASDRQVLSWVLSALCHGRLGVEETPHRDGSPLVTVDGRPTGLGGHDMVATS